MNQSDRRDSAGQSADLRTRIAAVYRAHRLTFFAIRGASVPKCDCGWRSPEEYTTWTDHPEHVADAVIRELRLTRVTRSERVPKHRYVTEWTADE